MPAQLAQKKIVFSQFFCEYQFMLRPFAANQVGRQAFLFLCPGFGLQGSDHGAQVDEPMTLRLAPGSPIGYAQGVRQLVSTSAQRLCVRIAMLLREYLGGRS